MLDTILKLIKGTIDSTKKSENALEKEIGLSQGQIKHWRNGRNKVSTESLIKLYDYYDVPTDYLLELTDSTTPYPKKSIKIIPIKSKLEDVTSSDYEYPIGRIITMPIIGVIAAGYGGQAQEEHIGDISFLAESLHGYMPEECFVLRVSGDSMLPELKDGDLVLIHRQPSVDSGDIAAVMYDGGDATLKRVNYVTGENWVEFIPENPAYPIKRIENSELEECRILGKLIDLVSRKY